MQRSGQYSELAGSLATVAIASLGGPVPALGAGLAAFLKYAQAKYLAGASTRDLHRQVTSSIEGWAISEHIDPHDVKLGIILATTTVAAAGVSTEKIASLDFDPTRVSKQILDAARAGDRWWGTEEHYAVAEAAVAEAYGVLILQIKFDPGAVIPTLQSLRTSIEASAEQATLTSRSLETGLDALMEPLISPASVAEVMIYLRKRIKDWDVSVWHPHGHAPSALEQRLRVRSSRHGEPVRELNAAEALKDQRMLVVLGGPGSGKSWLAHRYARETAQLALEKLEAGDDLPAVELPVLTTWDQWSRSQRTTAELRESLVASSFASQLGTSDLGGRDTTGRIQRTLTDPVVKVLVIVDSLDEAADSSSRGEAGNLHSLSSLQDRRVVVTSRASWDAIGRGEADRSGGPLVVELRDLNYPDGVDAFIQAWFVDDQVRGQELIDQIRDRQELQQSVVVPLILTLYCLLAEQHDSGVQLLPTRRRELYKGIVERLLSGEWAGNSPGPDPAADVEACENHLNKWAWHAVHSWVTPAGLGNWGDEFVQPAQPRDADRERGIDEDHDHGQLTEAQREVSAAQSSTPILRPDHPAGPSWDPRRAARRKCYSTGSPSAGGTELTSESCSHTQEWSAPAILSEAPRANEMGVNTRFRWRQVILVVRLPAANPLPAQFCRLDRGGLPVMGSKLITPWFGAWLMSLLLAVVEGRSKKTFKTGLETRTQPFRDTVEVARKGLGALGAEPPVVGVGGRTGIT